MRPLRRDPAPSLLRYRLGRLWLTPSFRRIVKFGPLVALVLGCLFYMATSQTFHQTVAKMYADMRTSIVGRQEFRVTEMKVFGASQDLSEAVERVAAMALPVSSLELDVAGLRQRIEALPSVASAAVRVGSKGVLMITLSERVPAVIWRSGQGLALLSADGVELGRVASRLDRADLPLIAGKGADLAIEEALELIAIADPIADRLRGLQRVGARRWTLVLDRDQAIYLPEQGAKGALLRVVAMEQMEQLLDKDIRIVDLRDPKKPVLRLGELAVSDLYPQKTGDGE